MKWYGLIVFLYVLMSSLAWWGYTEKKQFNYPSAAFFDVYGLDVSHHQGDIDWSSVPNDKYKFVYIKATEGESFKDKNFVKNYRKAKENGFKVGAYHFWTFCKSAEAQLANLMNTVPILYGDLVPAIDMESAYSCGQEKDQNRVVLDLQKINDTILKNYGVIPVIYTTNEFVSVHPEILDFKNIFWMRSLVGPPLHKKDWGLWQYYNGARVSGIKGGVDVNVLNKRISLFRIEQ